MVETIHVQVEVVCAPHPREEIEDTLGAAGRQLALQPYSVRVEVCEGERLTAVLEFAMRRAAQYKVIDEIYFTVKMWTGAFYEDIAIRFPKDGGMAEALTQ
jgi:hypothetical protein